MGMARGIGIALAALLLWVAPAAAGEPVPDIAAGPELPIGLWWPPPPAETTAERYDEIAGAGFTFVHGGNGVQGAARSRRMLEQAEAAGLEAIVLDNRLRRPLEGDEVRATVAEVLSDYAGFPALAGFNLFDEPHADRFPALAALTAELRRQAPAELPYVNLWPSDVPATDWGTPTYEEYLRRFAEEVRPPVLSFDVYPLLSREDRAPGQRPEPLAEDGEALSREFFDNWEMVRRQALESGVPAWVFIQSIDYDLQPLLCPCRARRRPTEAEVRWQANVALAYGAKGIQWFTYWSPASNPGTSFGDGLLTAGGERTDLYDAARRVNPELQAVGRELMALESESVTHTGAPPPGARPHRPNAWVRSVTGDPAIVGRFEGDGVHRRRLLVVNRSMLEPARTTVRPQRPVAVAARLDPAAGAWSAGSPPGEPVELALPPGGAALLELERRP